MSYIHLFLKFEIIVDSFAVARNNIERSCVPVSSFPHDNNILQNYSTMPQPHFFFSLMYKLFQTSCMGAPSSWLLCPLNT